MAAKDLIQTGLGFKFLDPKGCTEYGGKKFQYKLPKGRGWGPWNVHPEPAVQDGKDCGPGRLHVMLNLNARYAPPKWRAWYCEFSDIVGGSNEKVGVRMLRLKRMAKQDLWAILQNGGAYLTGADLRRAYLRGAYLMGANLRRADLRGANLTGANLTGADLRRADLMDADLTGANLRRADLMDADLTGAYLTGADLRRADLGGANLTGANLRGANLTGADLTGADLRRATANEKTIWPPSFDPSQVGVLII